MSAPRQVSWAEADALGSLSTLLQSWDASAPVWVHEGPTTLSGDLSFEDQNHLVLGDLQVEGDLLNHELDGGGFLVVRGHCRARNVVSGGGQVVVTGDLIAREGVLAFYNHGWLEVRGGLTARLVAAEHSVFVKGQLHGVTIDFGGLPQGLAPTVTREQATRGAKQTFVDAVLNAQGYVDSGPFIERVLRGDPVLR